MISFYNELIFVAIFAANLKIFFIIFEYYILLYKHENIYNFTFGNWYELIMI